MLAGAGKAVTPAIAGIGTCFADDCYRCRADHGLCGADGRNGSTRDLG